MQLQQVLFSQGFGTRRVCVGLIEQGWVRLQGRPCLDPYTELDTQNHLEFEVASQSRPGAPLLWQTWVYCEHAYIMLHKPAGYEVSQKPSAWPSVYTLLPMPLRLRSSGKLQAIGRLDQDTTGLLILSDDGAFIHRMSSPKKEVEKMYRVGCKHPLTQAMQQQLLSGVELHEEGRARSATVRASSCSIESEHTLLLGLTQGKYHQVKRMLAAVGNRVEQLSRIRIGALDLPHDLAPGAWRFLTEAQLLALSQPTPST